VCDPPTDRFEVLFVGQVSFRKGVPYLLQAFQQLRHPRKRLRIVGAIQEELRVFLKHHRFDSVEFLGALPQCDLVPIMSGSHVMVLPSIEDGLGLVLGQAMACGCPVICSTNTGGDELLPAQLREWVVPIRDSIAITDRLELLSENPDLQRQLSEHVMRRVADLGGWDDYGEKYSELCFELADQKAESTSVASACHPAVVSRN
jgi:glycosyltransferase involved in cell wall biosynthesis